MLPKQLLVQLDCWQVTPLWLVAGLRLRIGDERRLVSGYTGQKLHRVTIHSGCELCLHYVQDYLQNWTGY